MSRLLIALLAIPLAIVLALGSPQIARETTGSETLSGIVTRDDTKAALPFVRVKLELVDNVRLPTGHEKVCKPDRDRELSSEARRFAMTDVSGKFTFANVVAGRYYLTAEHEGYLTGAYGQKSGSPFGAVLEVGPQRDLVYVATDSDTPAIGVPDLIVVPVFTAAPPRGGLGSQQQGVSAGAPTALRDGTIAQTGQRGGLGVENANIPTGAGARSAIRDTEPAAPKIDLQNLAIPMVPAPTITGHVMNEPGAPLAAAAVQAYQFRYTPMNGRTLKSVRSTLTSDDGGYRMFWLNPGRYVIAAANSQYQLEPWMAGLTFTPNLPNPDTGLPVVFFPAATTAANAIPILLQRGLEPAADLRVLDRPRFTIRVRLTGNVIPPGSRLLFVPYGGDLCAGADYGLSSRGPGVFEIRDVPEGLYVAIAMSGRDFISDILTVKVEAKSIPSDIVVPVVPPVDVRGNIFFDVIPPHTFVASLRVNLVRSGQEVSQISTTEVDAATGRFVISGLGPGSYYPVVDLPPGAFVRDIVASRFDLNRPEDCDTTLSRQVSPLYSYLDLHGHFDPVKPFRIPGVIPNAAECLAIQISFGKPLFGIVRDKLLKPVKSALVVAIPRSVWAKELDKGATPPDRYLTAVTDDNGYFQMPGASDSEFHLYAFEDVDPNVIYNPEFSDLVFGRELFETHELQFENGKWAVKKIARGTVAKSETCGVDTAVYRMWCYLTSISAEDSAGLQ
jgi:hypothetical protein